MEPFQESFHQNFEAANIREKEDILMEKMAVIRNGIVRHLKISDNPVAIGEFMYEALYHPENIEELIEKLGIKDTEQFPNRTATLRKSISLSDKNIPTKEMFVHDVVRAITVEADFENCVFPEAEEQLKAMLEIGPVRIWTAGDKKGAKTSVGDFYPGSLGQLKKIARTGIFHELRKAAAVENEPNRRKEALAIRTEEDKFKQIPLIIQEFQEKGIKNVFIVEDNLPYLMKVEKSFQEAGFLVQPIWILNGSNRNKIPQEASNELQKNVIESVSEIKSVLEREREKGHGETGFVVDFDGVIMDSDLKIEAQGKAMIEKMKNNKWL